jgi:hypothetical protein
MRLNMRNPAADLEGSEQQTKTGNFAVLLLTAFVIAVSIAAAGYSSGFEQPGA